ncbi:MULTISPECIES: hypothetical protein [unclassified Bifidobacterium]|uniref:hypothetical protein n=1 Tax=unclassified Bifidobacterium TaxID=2608897 RepID=UPI001126A838|nr:MULTISPECIES: hypothetical protein [unclassified Bifidobacterium]TPF78761.1 hypothetical protein BW09_01910 [Bifidobacterium sp. UTCIF-1]TPF80745.1 hypothetical protein BW08_03455 [Bifidobacterium sp. UTCIF-24]TPF82650.1 hypothetical protein BW12_04115 [Bifidobacterium sp. UTCIF-3]TPF84791.1 hypothetical protein BW07_03385 [Bifidobacterium sp. UTCIF-36]TPF90076.1 hypothetical protein BW10_03720 [Bifidobacterium sp. UTBIF-56]
MNMLNTGNEWYRRIAQSNREFPIPDRVDGSRGRQKAMLENGPERNQVWMLRDRSHLVEYAVVLAVGSDCRTLMVTAMSNDTRLQTDDSMVLADTPLGMPMLIWPKLTIEVPVRLLDVPLGELGEVCIRKSLRYEASDIEGVAAGRYSSVDYHRAIAAFRNRVKVFAQWHKLCAQLPELPAAKSPDRLERDDSTGKLLDALIDVLGMEPYDAVPYAKHDKELSDGQKRQLAQAGVDERVLNYETELPRDLLIEVEQPRWRHRAERTIAAGEDDCRMRLARKAKRNEFALAARANRQGREYWRLVLQSCVSEKGE